MFATTCSLFSLSIPSHLASVWREGFGGRIVANVSVAVEPLVFVPAPDDRARWIEGLTRAGCAADAEVRVGAGTSSVTTGGWPMRLVQAVVADGATVEARVVAFYRFFDYAAAAMLRVRTAGVADVDAWIAGGVDILATAAPEWSTRQTPAHPNVLGAVFRAPAPS